MTAAQTKARERFKAAVKEAAKLRKKNPKLTQADAVRQAWAKLYGKSKGKKIGAPRKASAFRKVTKKTATKKAAPKKCAPKKPATGERHTDTKSHNVNIRVMSGIYRDYLLVFDKKTDLTTKRVKTSSIQEARRIASQYKKVTPSLAKARVSVRAYKPV